MEPAAGATLNSMNARGLCSVVRLVALGVIATLPSPAAGQTVEVPPNLILPNYDRIPVGQREGIEAGAYVARTDDAAANWFNPAGLAKSAQTTLAAAATAYEWTSLELDGFGTSAGRSRISSIGTLVSVVIGEGTIRSDQWRLGFSITRPIVWQPSTIDIAFPLQAGSELVGYTSDVGFDVMIPGVAVAFAPGGVTSGKFRIGAGLGLAITTLTQEQTISDRVTTATTASVARRDFSADGSVWHLQPTGGVQWDPTPRFKLGARVVAPSLRVHGSSALRLENSRFTVGDLSDLVFRDSTVEFDYRFPFQATVGAAVILGGGGAVELDVHYYGAIDPYAMYASTVPGRLTTQTGGSLTVTTPPFTTTTNSARSVVNVAIGGHHPLSKALGVHAGFSTDQSPVDDQAQSIFRKVNLSRVTAGMSLTGTSLSGSLGLGYSFGSGTRQTLGSTVGGQVTETQLKVRTVNVLFALSYAFHSP